MNDPITITLTATTGVLSLSKAFILSDRIVIDDELDELVNSLRIARAALNPPAPEILVGINQALDDLVPSNRHCPNCGANYFGTKTVHNAFHCATPRAGLSST